MATTTAKKLVRVLNGNAFYDSGGIRVCGHKPFLVTWDERAKRARLSGLIEVVESTPKPSAKKAKATENKTDKPQS